MPDIAAFLARARTIAIQSRQADVAELVDARDLKSLDGNVVWVRLPPPAPRFALTALRVAQPSKPSGRSVSGVA